MKIQCFGVLQPGGHVPQQAMIRHDHRHARITETLQGLVFIEHDPDRERCLVQELDEAMR